MLLVGCDDLVVFKCDLYYYYYCCFCFALLMELDFMCSEVLQFIVGFGS